MSVEKTGLLYVLAVFALSAQPNNPTEASYNRARQALDRSVAAHGGLQRMQAIEDIYYRSHSDLTEAAQSIDPTGPPYIRPVETEGVIDTRGRRSAQRTNTVFVGGGEFRVNTVLLERSGFTADLGGNAVYPLHPAALAANQRLAQRTFPHLILQTALRRAATLRWLGTQSWAGRPQEAITFADVDGTAATLYIDAATGLLTATSAVADRLIEGFGAAETAFSDYRDVDGVRVPFHAVTTFRGQPLGDVRYSEVKLNTRPAASFFTQPTGALAGPEVGGPPPAVTLTSIGKDAYLVNAFDTGGVFFYSSIFVVFNEYVVAVEAPLSDSATQAILAKIHEVAPGKAVKYLVQTHDHSDHLGGIRGYIAEGATIVATPATASVVRTVASVNHPFNADRLQRAPRPVSIETLPDKRVFDDGTHRIEFYNVGPTPHALEILVAYLPAEKTLFVSDLVPVTYKGTASPRSPVFVAFYEQLKKMGLDVRTTISGHGRIAPIEELQKLVETGQ